MRFRNFILPMLALMGLTSPAIAVAPSAPAMTRVARLRTAKMKADKSALSRGRMGLNQRQIRLARRRCHAAGGRNAFSVR